MSKLVFMILKLSKIGVLLGLVTLVVFTSCSVEEEESNDYPDVKNAATEFIYNVTYGNFKDAEMYCDKSSFASVRKLSNHYSEFESIYFESVDTCIISGDSALCSCLFSNDFDNPIHQDLRLVKYDGEWLVNFILDENFSNIFMYDYSVEKSLNFKDNTIAAFNSDELLFLNNFIERINSNNCVIGFSNRNDINSFDPEAFNEYTDEVQSEQSAGSVILKTKYYLDYDFETGVNEEVLSSLEMNLLAVEGNSHEYFEDLIKLMVGNFGTPFNLQDVDEADYYQYKSLRWFLKNHNEILELRIRGSFIELTLSSCI